jgi:hypothetical protein
MDRLNFRVYLAAASLWAVAGSAALDAQARVIAEPAIVRPAVVPLPSSRLSVMVDGQWREWWKSASAPHEWSSPDESLLRAFKWRPVTDGVEWAEVRLAGTGEAWRLRLIVARVDPARVQFGLDTAFNAARTKAAWSIENTADDVLVALNAGQFPRAMPWGWVAINGREFLPPGQGPLSMGVAFDAAGAVRWIPGDSLQAPGVRSGTVTGFQSYPTLLVNGAVPEPLRAGELGIDVEHRDARLAIGQDRDGHILVAMTRFDGAGAALGFVPFGLTTPEMAAVMGALGAANAVMLDGGISSQLLIRDPSGVCRWTGLRNVPLGLTVRARGAQAR